MTSRVETTDALKMLGHHATCTAADDLALALPGLLRDARKMLNQLDHDGTINPEVGRQLIETAFRIVFLAETIGDLASAIRVELDKMPIFEALPAA